MKVEALDNPGTPTRLAKQIRVITKRIIESETRRSNVPDIGSKQLTLTDEQYESLETDLDAMLAKRTYLIEALIGYLANDDFNKRYLQISNRKNVLIGASANVRKNIKTCQSVYNNKVKSMVVNHNTLK